MENFQVRVLALMTGHGFVLLKFVEYSMSGELDAMWPEARSFLVMLPVLGLSFAFTALQQMFQSPKSARTSEEISSWIAVVIGVLIAIYPMWDAYGT